MKTKGFTLVELLVVIAILAILATVSVVGYTTFIDRANQSTALQEMTQIKESVVAEDILNPNFAISKTGIEKKDNEDPKYTNFDAYVSALATELGSGRTCVLEGTTKLVFTNTDKKVKAIWDFTTGNITTEKIS